MTATVGLVGRPTDPHAAAVAASAAAQGARVVPIDTTTPAFARWHWDQDGRLHDDRGRAVELDAVYVRSVAVPLPRTDAPVAHGDQLERWLVTAEERRRQHLHARAVHAWFEASAALVANSVDATWFHRSKPAADLRLRAAAIPTPRCLVTDDPASVRGFVATVGDAVRKPIAGGGACVAVDPGRLGDADLRGLATAPALFQERILGDDLRVYVVDGEVVAAVNIRTTALDYRGHEDEVVPIPVDVELAELCIRVAEVLGLVFTGIDVKRGADGRLTVLDANPSPMFLGIERRTGLPITDRLAARLASVDG